MNMHNPPHPGEILQGLWLEPMGVTVTIAAEALGISRQSLSNRERKPRSYPGNGGSYFPRIWRNPGKLAWAQAAYDLWRIEQNRGPRPETA